MMDSTSIVEGMGAAVRMGRIQKTFSKAQTKHALQSATVLPRLQGDPGIPNRSPVRYEILDRLVVSQSFVDQEAHQRDQSGK